MRVHALLLTVAALGLAGCPSSGPQSFKLGGTVEGMQGGGLVLVRSGGETLTIFGNGPFQFATPEPTGASYTIQVRTHPTQPSQTCTLENATGTVGTAEVTNILVRCVTNKYTVGGVITGVEGTGMVLQNNGGDDLTILKPGGFTFATPVESEKSFAVTIKTHPSAPTQTCSVQAGAGQVKASPVTTVTINCTTNRYLVGGTVTGLAGSGLVLRLQDGQERAISADGSFAFPTAILSGTAYTVTVKTEPSNLWQTCTVNGGTGVVGGVDVSTVNVVCANNVYKIGGTISGLKGSGLILTLNGGGDLPVSADGAFEFATGVASGSNYLVEVKNGPLSPSQTCAITDGSGPVTNADITSVTIACTTDKFAVGGTVSGLAGTGLVLQNNGGDNLPIGADGEFAFTTPIESGAAYLVTVLTQPGGPAQTCTVSAGESTVGNGPVTSVAVNCDTTRFTIGGQLFRLAGSGLVLTNNGGDDLELSANGVFSFATPLPEGADYDVQVKTQPVDPLQTCTVTDGTGKVGTSNVITITVDCVTRKFPVSVSVKGLAGSVLVLENNAAEELRVTTNGTHSFLTQVDSGATYEVTVFEEPTSPWQTCTVIEPSGTIVDAGVTVDVRCTTDSFLLNGTVTGLEGDRVVLSNQSGETVTVNRLVGGGDVSFEFPTPITSGQPWSISVASQPNGPWQTCQTPVTSSGPVEGADVAVTITCTTNAYLLKAKVVGLVELDTLVVQNDNLDELTFRSSWEQPFATPLLSGDTYSVSVTTQPAGTPCVISAPSGSITNADVSVLVNCTGTFTVGGTVAGLSGAGLQLTNNGTDLVAVSANGSFTFPTPLAGGAGYSVAVTTQPGTPAQTCTVTGGSGTVGSADVTSVAVSCATRTFTVGGTVSGLNGSLVLQNNGGDNLPVSANGPFTFATAAADRTPYDVGIAPGTAPEGQRCAVTQATGSLAGANVTSVQVGCSNLLSVSGSISGLSGTGMVVQLYVNNALAATDVLDAPAGAFSFPFVGVSGESWELFVSDPVEGTQACSASPAGGTFGSTDVTGVVITCG